MACGTSAQVLKSVHEGIVLFSLLMPSVSSKNLSPQVTNSPEYICHVTWEARRHAFHCGVFSMSQKKEVSPNKCAQQSRERRRLCRKTGGERDRQDHPSRPLGVARQQACWEATLTGFLMGLGSQLLLKLLTSHRYPSCTTDPPSAQTWWSG